MAYVGYVINSHFCYNNVAETISKGWTFSGNNTYNGTSAFNKTVTIKGGNLSIKNGDTENFKVAYDTGDTTIKGTLGVTGAITAAGNNTWNGTQTFKKALTIEGAITSSGNNTWSGTNKFTQTITGTSFTSLYGDIAEYFILNIDNINNEEYNMKKFKGYLVELSHKDGEVVVTKPNSRKFIGVISKNPSMLINSKIANEEKAVPVAYLGRVDCFVIGKVKKGQALTTSKIPGVAKKRTILDKLLGKPIIGYALEDKTRDFNYQIEIVLR